MYLNKIASLKKIKYWYFIHIAKGLLELANKHF